MGNKDMSAFLKPVDPTTLPKRRGRGPLDLYPGLLEAFVASNQSAMEVDAEALGKKPLTLRQGLNLAAKRLELTDKVLVSLFGDGRVVLQLRK